MSARITATKLAKIAARVDRARRAIASAESEIASMTRGNTRAADTQRISKLIMASSNLSSAMMMMDDAMTSINVVGNQIERSGR